MVELDDRDYQVALSMAQARVAAERASIEDVDAQISVRRAQVAQNEAQVQQQAAGLTFAQQQAYRLRNVG